jgi:predicted transcriptional regulator
MKKERNTVTISDSRVVSVPNEVRMTISEIADLFGIYYQTAKKLVRAIEKSGVADGDNSMSCTVEGMKIYPDYYGLEMIIAVAFRIQSHEAEIFRNWLVRKAVAVVDIPKIKILICRKWNNISLN